MAVPQYPPGSRVRTSNPRECVDILRSEEGLEAADPVTVGQMFLDTVRKYPTRPALCFKEEGSDGDWKEITFTEYYQLALQAAKSLIYKLGLEPFSPVAFIGFLSPECLYCYFGSILAGGIAVGLPVGSTPEGCLYMLNHCKAQFVLAEDYQQVDKVLQIRCNLPHLKAIVQYKGEVVQKCDKVFSWLEFLSLAGEVTDNVLEERMKEQKAGQCAGVVFSSGTTGHHKSVMMSHDNLTWATKMLHSGLSPGLGFGVDRLVTCDALCYISCLNLDLYLTIYCASTLYFAPPSARLSERELFTTVRQVKPTLFFGSASNWEQIRSILEEDSAGTLETAREYLGLEEARILLTAGGTVPIQLLEYFERLGMTLVEAFGMSENIGGITINPLDRVKPGSVGRPYPGSYIRIDSPDGQGDGEILVFSRQAFMGYMYDEKRTKSTKDDQGWIHSGDIGRLDSDGYLYITGRMKDMIVPTHGHNVAPVLIEARIRKEVPFLSHVILVGDALEYICCLVTLKTVTDPRTGEPLDRLTPTALAQIAQLGSKCTTVSAIVEQRDEVVYSAIQRGLDRANEHLYDVKDRVEKFTILKKDFSVFSGEIGDTMKLKRHVIKQKFEAQINAMYSE